MRKKHIIYITVLTVMLSVMLVGTVLTSQACGPKKTRVHFSPRSYVWDKKPPKYWRAHMMIGWWRACRIDSNTILLEGTLAPEKTRKRWLILTAYFDGDAVVSILGSKLGHDVELLPGKYEVELSISGKFINGKPFECTGIIKVIVP